MLPIPLMGTGNSPVNTRTYLGVCTKLGELRLIFLILLWKAVGPTGGQQWVVNEEAVLCTGRRPGVKNK